MATNNPKRKAARLRQKKAENLRRRKETLLKKVYELGRDFGVDVALILRHNSRFITYRSIDIESWPPSMKEIKTSYPLPKNMLPQDIEKRLQSSMDQNLQCITDIE